MTTIGIDKVCFIVGKSPATVYKMMKDGEFPRPIDKTDKPKMTSEWDFNLITEWVNEYCLDLQSRIRTPIEEMAFRKIKKVTKYKYDRITNRVSDLIGK